MGGFWCGEAVLSAFWAVLGGKWSKNFWSLLVGFGPVSGWWVWCGGFGLVFRAKKRKKKFWSISARGVVERAFPTTTRITHAISHRYAVIGGWGPEIRPHIAREPLCAAVSARKSLYEIFVSVSISYELNKVRAVCADTYYSYRGVPTRRPIKGVLWGKNRSYPGCACGCVLLSKLHFRRKVEALCGCCALLRQALCPIHSLPLTAPTKTCLLLPVVCASVLCPRAARKTHPERDRQSCRRQKAVQRETWLKRKRYLIVAAFQGNFN